MKPAHLCCISVVAAVFVTACAPPKATSDDDGTTELESSSSAESTGATETSESDSSDWGEPPPAEPDECSSSSKFGVLNFGFGQDGFDSWTLGPGASTQTCTVVDVSGTLADLDANATALFECPGLEPTAQTLELWVSAYDELDGLPLSPGEVVEVRGWIAGMTLVFDVRNADTLEPRVTFVSIRGNEFVLTDFLDGGGPAPDFLAPYAIEAVDLGCDTQCDPGRGTFLPACQWCDTRMGLAISIDGLPAEVLPHSQIASIPADQPRARAYGESIVRTSEDCEEIRGSYELLLLAVN